LLGSAVQASLSKPALRILLRTFAAARRSSTLSSLRFGLLLSSAFQASLSNPALRILLRAFAAARNAIQGISQARPLTLL